MITNLMRECFNCYIPLCHKALREKTTTNIHAANINRHNVNVIGLFTQCMKRSLNSQEHRSFLQVNVQSGYTSITECEVLKCYKYAIHST